ncbi:endonuclease/exonuclease/phosphatase family protein [Enterococcus sp. BWR-S5]|uniref:endonuclease/exonuclease/phosphatase family protein n=1 Tax=Enterococcus sp. BWR-S5 TaxID=2787714 RepID=UPI0019214423|nr:endonuclease/exonuclease/phosphatase family protein [Enterococcus sp. BWR-S5]MBL1225582.1 endonuclease/exonuclease/phosphatase family protein [Enterococcus sp. BWR-S5]
MKILTLNTHSWLEDNPLEKLEQLAKVIVEREYDLIALQEVNQSITADTEETDVFFHGAALDGLAIHADNFALLLSKKLQSFGQSYYWCWQPVHIGYGRYHEGVALFSKKPIDSKGYLVSKQSEFTDYRTRKILFGRTQLDGREVVAVSCHYSWWLEDETEGFLKEWQQTLEHLAEYDVPILLLGDFNNPAGMSEQGYELVLKHFRDSYEHAEEIDGEHTVVKEIDGWSGNNQKLRIDFVFTSEEIKAKRYEVLFDGRKTPIISDHFGIEATLDYR